MLLGICDSDLLASTRAGDANALRAVLAISRSALCDYVSRKIPSDVVSHCSADDVVQETHIEVFKRIDKIDHRSPEAFSRWILAIALSRLRNAIRHCRAVKRDTRKTVNQHAKINDSSIQFLELLAGPDRTPSTCARREEAVTEIHRAIAELPKDIANAVHMVYIEDRSVQTTAEAMGRTQRAINGLCRRGRDQLRAKLLHFLSSSG